MVIMTTVSFYLITVYTPSFGKNVLKLAEGDALLVTLAVGASNFFWLPISGALSDKIGSKRILLFTTTLLRRRTFRSTTRRATDFISSECGIVSKYLDKSASTTSA